MFGKMKIQAILKWTLTYANSMIGKERLMFLCKRFVPRYGNVCFGLPPCPPLWCAIPAWHISCALTHITYTNTLQCYNQATTYIRRTGTWVSCNIGTFALESPFLWTSVKQINKALTLPSCLYDPDPLLPTPPLCCSFPGISVPWTKLVTHIPFGSDGHLFFSSQLLKSPPGSKAMTNSGCPTWFVVLWFTYHMAALHTRMTFILHSAKFIG